MLNYSIHLRNMNDLRKYSGFLNRFTVRGHLLTGMEELNIYDLLEIMSQSEREDLHLVLETYSEKEVGEMDKYLRETGLLNPLVVENSVA